MNAGEFNRLSVNNARKTRVRVLILCAIFVTRNNMLQQLSSRWSVVMVTSTWRRCNAAMATSKMSLSLMTPRSYRSSTIDYSPVSTNEPTAIDDGDPPSRLPSTGDVSFAVTVPSPSHRQPTHQRLASTSAETGPQKDQDSLTPSVSDILSVGAEEAISRRRNRMSSVRVLLQTKVYNFLERPTGWRCFLYHFCV